MMNSAASTHIQPLYKQRQREKQPPSEGEGHAVGLWEICQGAMLHMAEHQLSLTLQFGDSLLWPQIKGLARLESQESPCPPSVALSKCCMYLDAVAII